MAEEQGALAGQTLAAYVEKKWGGPTRALPLVSVTAVGPATRVAQGNPRRMMIAIYNLSTGNVYWGLSSAESQLNLVLLTPLGGSMILLADEDGEMVGYEQWVAPIAASAVIGVMEVVRK